MNDPPARSPASRSTAAAPPPRACSSSPASSPSSSCDRRRSPRWRSSPAIVAMIMLHELGHFVTAEVVGMKVTEYFLGFGPRLWSIRRGETEYGVKAIPAGGYVRIVGMTTLEEVDPADEPRSYPPRHFPATLPRRDRRLGDAPAHRLRAVLRRRRRRGRVAAAPNDASRCRHRRHRHEPRRRTPGSATGTASSASTGNRISSWNGLIDAIESARRPGHHLHRGRATAASSSPVDGRPRPAESGKSGSSASAPARAVPLGRGPRRGAAVGRAPCADRHRADRLRRSPQLVSPAGLSSFATDFTSKSSSATTAAGSSSSGSSRRAQRPARARSSGPSDRAQAARDGNIWRAAVPARRDQPLRRHREPASRCCRFDGGHVVDRRLRAGPLAAGPSVPRRRGQADAGRLRVPAF